MQPSLKPIRSIDEHADNPEMTPGRRSEEDLRPDGGFTLIELMVVVAVIAVLIAIAIPSFLGFRSGSQDRAAQASLITAEKTALGIALEDGEFLSTNDSVTLFNSLEPAIEWLRHKDDSTGPTVVSIDEDNGRTNLNFAAFSQSGTCFYSRVSSDLAIAVHGKDTSASDCNAHDFQNESGSGW